jgi:hypothetical protein
LEFFAGVIEAAHHRSERAFHHFGDLLVIEALPTVYFTGESLDAEVIADSNGEVSAIVVNGLSAIRDDIDVATVTTSTVLPKSYSKSEARRFD